MLDEPPNHSIGIACSEKFEFEKHVLKLQNSPNLAVIWNYVSKKFLKLKNLSGQKIESENMIVFEFS